MEGCRARGKRARLRVEGYEMRGRLQHGATRGRNYRTVAAPPIPAKYDPARAVMEDVEAVLLDAGMHQAVRLLRDAGRGPSAFRIENGHAVEVASPWR
jgi:hypothetical protein